MKISNKLYFCKICNKKKQLSEYYIYKTGNQKGKRTSCTCILCTKKIKLEYRKNNPDLVRGYRETFYSKQEEDYFEREKTRKVKWAKDNPDKVKEMSRDYRQNNKPLLASNRANYRSKKLNRTPSWMSPKDLADIRSIYKMCKKISEKTGTLHHVDHIIPLQGKLVSGLHIPSNLRVIEALSNLSKGNTYEII